MNSKNEKVCHRRMWAAVVVVAGGGAHAHNAEAEGHSHWHGEEAPVAPVAKHAHSIQDLSVGLAVLCE